MSSIKLMDGSSKGLNIIVNYDSPQQNHSPNRVLKEYGVSSHGQTAENNYSFENSQDISTDKMSLGQKYQT